MNEGLTDSEWSWITGVIRPILTRGIPLNPAEEARLAGLLPRIRIPRPRPTAPGTPPPTVPIANPPPLSQSIA